MSCRSFLGLGFLLLAGTACGASDDADAQNAASSEDGAESESHESSTETGAPDDSLPGAFEAQGFTVQAGHASSFMVEDCEDLDDCYGNNPTSPYLFFSVPPHPEHPDSAPASTGGEIPKIPTGMTPAYRLEANEAIVIVGELPPSAAYFGLTPYLFERQTPGGLVPVFASLSDSLNHTNLQTEGSSPFGERVAIVFAGEAETRDAARDALVAHGLTASIINHLVLPTEGLELGVGDDADTTLLLGRVALFEDEAAGAEYLEAPPFEVFRLTPSTSGTALPTPQRAEKGDGTDENQLISALDALEAAIKASLDAEGLTHEDVPIASPGAVALAIDPERCLDMNTECLGDNSDALYAAGPLAVFQGSGSLTLAPDEAFYLFGVNHAASGKAEYSSAAVYGRDQRVGVVSLDDEQMMGTASAYLPDHPDVDSLFVVEVRRDCQGRSDCLEVATDFPGVGLESSLFFMFRSYVNPGSSVSPAPDEVLGERALKVSAL